MSTSDSSDDAYYDPALFGIMGALALMFIIMCVVLQLFARSDLINYYSIIIENILNALYESPGRSFAGTRTAAYSTRPTRAS